MLNQLRQIARAVARLGLLGNLATQRRLAGGQAEVILNNVLNPLVRRVEVALSSITTSLLVSHPQKRKTYRGHPHAVQQVLVGNEESTHHLLGARIAMIKADASLGAANLRITHLGKGSTL